MTSGSLCRKEKSKRIDCKDPQKFVKKTHKIKFPDVKFGFNIASSDCTVTTDVVPPGHGLSGEELQFIVVQTEAAEGEQASERLGRQVVQGVVAQTKPLDVVETLEKIRLILYYMWANLTHGSEPWALSSISKKKINVFKMWQNRRIDKTERKTMYQCWKTWEPMDCAF